MLTPSQQRALHTGHHISVTAGAGSGKTHILVLKYLAYLEKWLSLGLREILALTFTNKAAQEMKSRIRERILEKIQSADLPSVEKEKWKRIREEIGSAYISTIHGFCARLLKENPVLSGIDPDFGILQGPDQILLMDEALLLTFKDLEKKQHPSYQELLSRYPKYEIAEFIMEILLGEPDYPFHIEGHLPWDERRIAGCLKDFLREDKGLIESIKALEDFLERDFFTDAFFSDLQDFIEGFARFSKEEISLDHFRSRVQQVFVNPDKGNIRTGFKSLFKSLKTDQKEELNNLLIGTKDQIKDLLPFLDLARVKKLEEMSCELLNHHHQILKIARENFQKIKRKKGLLDFNDLQTETLRFLRKHPGVRTFGALLVDEFQDTNQLQWEIIRLLGHQESDFFLVGDEKQSIYGFRGAEVEVFAQVRDELNHRNLQEKPQGAPEPVELSENFRSLPSIIGGVNHLFEKLLSKEARKDPTEPDFMALRCSRIIPHQDLYRGSIEILLEGLDQEKSPSAEEQRDLEAEMMARRIREAVQQSHPRALYLIEGSEEGKSKPTSPELRYLKGIPKAAKFPHLRQAQFSDMAILIRSRTILPQIEEALRRHRIPYYVPSGIGFYQRQEIKDLGALLSFLVEENDDYALWGTLRSPLFGFPEELVFLISSFPGRGLFQKFKKIHSYLSQLRDLALASLGVRNRDSEIKKAFPDLEKEHRENLSLLFSPLEKKYHLTGAELIQRTKETLDKWRQLCQRLPIAKLLREILHQSGYLASLSAFQNGSQKVANVEKFLEGARKWDFSKTEGLRSFARRVKWLIQKEKDEGEAQLESGENAVRIFTIHMSKGLQFPIVFLAQLSKTFQRVQETFLFEKDLGCALRPVDPEDLYQKQSTLSWTALKKKKEAKALAEEKRLFYVGATRAKDHLIFSGYWNKDVEKDDRCWLSWLRQYWDLTPQNLRKESFSCKGSENTLHFQREWIGAVSQEGIWVSTLTRSDLDRVEEDTLEKPTLYQRDFYRELQGTEETRQLEFAFRGEASQVFHISPSNLSSLSKCPRKFYYERILHLPDQLKRKGSSRKAEKDEALTVQQFGTLSHRALELLIKGLSEDEIFPQLEWEFPALKAPDELGSILKKFASSALGAEILRSGEAYPEEPFLARIGPSIIQGSIDLLWIAQGKYHIIDFKTTRRKGMEDPENTMRNRYSIPMGIYSWAIWKRFSLDPEQIFTSLVLTEAPDKPIDYPPWTRERFWELENTLGEISKNYGFLLNMLCPPIGHFKPNLDKCPHCPMPKVCERKE